MKRNKKRWRFFSCVLLNLADRIHGFLRECSMIRSKVQYYVFRSCNVIPLFIMSFNDIILNLFIPPSLSVSVSVSENHCNERRLIECAYVVFKCSSLIKNFHWIKNWGERVGFIILIQVWISDSFIGIWRGGGNMIENAICCCCCFLLCQSNLQTCTDSVCIWLCKLPFAVYYDNLQNVPLYCNKRQQESRCKRVMVHDIIINHCESPIQN